MKNFKIKHFLVLAVLLLSISGCDPLFDTGDTETVFDGQPQLAFFPLQNTVNSNGSRYAELEIQLIGAQQSNDLFPEFTFETDINFGLMVSDAADNTQVLTLGTEQDATTGFDPEYDEEAQSPPDASAFDARITTDSQDFITFFQPTTQGETRWNIEFRASNGNTPITFSWYVNQLTTAGQLTLRYFDPDEGQDGDSVNVDMREVEELILEDETISEIEFIHQFNPAFYGTHFEVINKSIPRPTFNIETGYYEQPVDVEIESSIINSGFNASIYYTTDGTTPTSGSTRYTGPFTVNESATIKAIVIFEGGQENAYYQENSLVSVIDVNIGEKSIKAPVFSVESGGSDNDLDVPIAHSNQNRDFSDFIIASEDDRIIEDIPVDSLRSRVLIFFTTADDSDDEEPSEPEDPTVDDSEYRSPRSANLNRVTSDEANETITHVFKAIAVRFALVLDEDGMLELGDVLETSNVSRVEYLLDPSIPEPVGLTEEGTVRNLLPSNGSISDVRIRFLQAARDSEADELVTVFDLQSYSEFQAAPNLKFSTLFIR